MIRATALAAVALLLAVPARADGDAAQGQVRFRRCMPCHHVGDGAQNSVGPQLNGIVGRRAAGIAGFAYSGAMRRADFTWDEAHLRTFLADPRATVRGTNMTFAGISDPQTLDDVIAYLKTLSPKP